MRLVLSAVVLLAACATAAADGLPDGFVRIGDVAPTIREDIRYAGSNNFAGRPLKGYEAPVCILREDAAKALARVQAGLTKEGLTLVVYDCYRPVRAVTDILGWSSAKEGPKNRPAFPALDRRKLVSLGYIASKSMHSTGYAVDLGLARIDQAPSAGMAAACTAPVDKRGDQGALDFGTAYDCFDPKSWTRAAGLPPQVAANRARLVKAMQAEGFSNYAREWWHFTYDKHAGARAQDFLVTAK